ncbi:MAG: cupredoxin domain-containing protein [Thermomicrobiales bacterium]
MGIGNRPIAWLALGLLGLGLLGAIALQTVTPPTPPTAAPQAAAPTTAAASPTAVSNASGGGAGATINATEKDFAISLDNSSVAAGSVTFKIKNDGPSPHNITIKEMNKASDNIDAGKTGQFTIDLPAGTYTVICNIPGHEQLGMHTMLTVK